MIPGATTKGGDLATVLDGLRTDMDAVKCELVRSRKRLRRLRLGYWFLFILVLALTGWIAGGLVWPAECEELMGRVTERIRTLLQSR